MTKEKQNKILSEIVIVLKNNGIKIDSPYDVKNFLEDHGSNEDFLNCGQFKHLIDDENND